MSREIEELNWLKAEYNCNNPRHKRLVDFLYNTVTPILSADVGEALEAIKWIYTTLLGIKFEGQITNETYSIWVLTALIPIENALYQAEAQSRELAEVKKKIKRYIELNNKSITLDCEYDEFERLEKELSSDE